MHMSEATPFACISVSDVCMPQRSQKEFQQVHDQLVIGRHCAAKDVRQSGEVVHMLEE